MKKFSALLVLVFATSLFANEDPPAAPAAGQEQARPAMPAKKKPAPAAKKPAPATHKPTSMVQPTDPTAAAAKPVEGGAAN